ncbi:MAG: hypothetical protein ACNA7W_20215 [Pseudomonadales bacterium]
MAIGSNIGQYKKALKEYVTALTATAEIVSFLRQELGGEVTLNQAVLLLQVMRNEALGLKTEMRDLSISTRLDRRATSRLVASLGSGNGARPGLQLIEQTMSDTDKRTRLLALTEKGVQLTKRTGQRMRSEAFSAIDRIDELRARQSSLSDTG